MVVPGVHEEVEHAARGAVQQGHVTEDAGQPPLVLVLQVRARRPLVHPDGERVAPRPEQMAHGELVRQPGSLELAEIRAVQPDPGAGLDPVEAQHRTAVGGPVHRQVEEAQMVAGRVLGRHVRRVDRERVEVVGVDRRAVPLQHPVAGDLDLGPVLGVLVLVRRVPLGGEGVVARVGGGGQPDVPTPVQGKARGVRGRVMGARRQRAVAGGHVLDVAGVGGCGGRMRGEVRKDMRLLDQPVDQPVRRGSGRCGSPGARTRSVRSGEGGGPPRRRW